MKRILKLCRWPRFSLRTFMLVCLIGGGCVAWISQSYNQYVVEQGLIENLVEKMPPGTLLSVVTNGENTGHYGGYLM